MTLVRIAYIGTVLLTSVSLLGGCNAAQSQGTDGKGTTAEQRPNIIWLVAEDISPRLAAYGDSLAHTPNIDALARGGMVLEHAFTTSGVCAPSRAAIITGMYSTSIGTQHMRQQPSVIPMPGPPQYNAVPPPYVKAFPELLRQAGYWTASYHKTDYQFGQPFTVWDSVSYYPSWRDRVGVEKDQPFFIYYTFEITHEINIWPDSTKQRFFRDFIPDTSKLAPDVLKRPPFDEAYAVDPADVTVPPYLPDLPVTRQHIARLYDNASRMDVQIGTIMKQLEEDGLLDDTIVFFLADHGDCLPRAKRWVYDSGIKIPLVVHVPERYRRAGMAQPGRRGQLVSGVDSGPTVLDLAGVEIPDWVQGRSIFSAPKRDYVFAGRDRIDNRYDTRRAVRDTRFKYIKNYFPEVPYSQYTTFLHQMPLMAEITRLKETRQLPPGQNYWLDGTKSAEELYDTNADPYEINNLAADPAYASDLIRLRQALLDWQAEVGDYEALPETEQAEAMWPGLVQPATAKPTLAIEDNRIVLSSETAGASIGYRLNGASQWRVYAAPLAADSVRHLETKAVRYGYGESAVVAQDFVW